MKNYPKITATISPGDENWTYIYEDEMFNEKKSLTIDKNAFQKEVKLHDLKLQKREFEDDKLILTYAQDMEKEEEEDVIKLKELESFLLKKRTEAKVLEVLSDCLSSIAEIKESAVAKGYLWAIESVTKWVEEQKTKKQ